MLTLRCSQACHMGKAISLLFLISSVAVVAAPAQTLTVLYSFTGGVDGGYPAEGLVRDSTGNLYGTTQSGGTGSCTQDGLNGCGTVFKVADQGAETVLYSFQGGSDGASPWGALTADKNGNLFGTATDGGLGFGVVFKLETSGVETVLHRFAGGVDGGTPYGGLSIDSEGNLYGTSDAGGDLSCGYEGSGCGTVFKLSANRGTVLHRFAGAPLDGNYPAYGNVLISDNGVVYGVTAQGGLTDQGSLYKVDRNGKEAPCTSSAKQKV